MSDSVAKKNRSIYYWEVRSNFGDLLNEYFSKELFEDDYVLEMFDKCDLLAVGSILERVLDHAKLGADDRKIRESANYEDAVHIWGSGLLYECDPKINKFTRKPIIHALRGRLTKQAVETILKEPVHCVLADPGLLVPLLVKGSEEKKYEIGIVPHYREKNNEFFQCLPEHYQNTVVIDVQQDVETVLRQISECRYIISSSLHGIIAADAYGIPNCWCIASDQVFGGGYKFHDYFSSFGSDREVIDLRTGSIPKLDEDFCLSYQDYCQVQAKQIALLNAFPFALKERFGHRKTEEDRFREAGSFPVKKTADRFNTLIQAKNGSEPLVSAIVPVYNTAQYLDQCLESVEKQTLKEIEIICVDDGSTDDSLDVLLRHALKDERITIVTQENCGQSAARNLGIDLARGKYLYYLDSDDFIDTDGLECLYHFAEKNHLETVFFDGRILREGDEENNITHRSDDYYIRKHEYPELTDGRTLFKMMRDNKEYRVQPAMLFSLRSFITGHQICFVYGIIHEDEEYMYKLLLHCERAGYLNRQFYHRRIRSNSTMTNTFRFANAYGYYKCFNVMNADLSAAGTGPEYEPFAEHLSGMLRLAKDRYRKLNKQEKEKYKKLPSGDKKLFEMMIAKDSDEIQSLSIDLQSLRSSVSYRVGRVMTYLPRKIKAAIALWKKTRKQKR
ncbi:MAG: glycosyltransferase [Erysipelotrichaceae bacterium]|nr:glycosyltransferase [Erysipelotrichaceae bacterium]